VTEVKMKVEDGVLYYYKEQDVEPILERNARKRGEDTGWTGEFYEVAEVPEVVILEWLKEWGVTWREFVCDPMVKARCLKRLNDPQYIKFRTKEGRL